MVLIFLDKESPTPSGSGGNVNSIHLQAFGLTLIVSVNLKGLSSSVLSKNNSISTISFDNPIIPLACEKTSPPG